MMTFRLVSGAATSRLTRNREPSALTSVLVLGEVRAVRVRDQVDFEERLGLSENGRGTWRDGNGHQTSVR